MISPLKNTTLTTRVVLSALAVAVVAWGILEYLQSQALERIYREVYATRLSVQAQSDRLRFDEAVRKHYNGTVTLSRLSGVRAAVAGIRTSTPDWDAPETNPPEPAVDERADWLPERSMLRNAVVPDLVVLLDTQYRPRRAFTATDMGLPPMDRRPYSLLAAKSMDQTLITDVNGRPHILAAAPVTDDDGATIGTLMSFARLDSAFLRQVQQSRADRDSIVALLDGEQSVLASSDERILPVGADFAAREGTFLITGKAFFDYGSAEIQTNIVTLMPQARFKELLAPVLRADRTQRTIAAVLFGGMMMVFVLYLTRRIRYLGERVGTFTERAFGAALPEDLNRGDELQRAESRFEHLTREILASREKIEEETAKRLEALRRSSEAHAEIQRLQLLRSVTEAMGVGILELRGPGKVVPHTPTMERFIQRCGGPHPFADIKPGIDIKLPCKETGKESVYEISRPPGLSERYVLVRDVTETRTYEHRVRSLALFPAQNPNPVLRVAADGAILHANPASSRVLGDWGVEENGAVPGFIEERVSRALQRNVTIEYELTIDDRTFATTISPVESEAYVNIYFTDITGRKRAEEALQQTHAELEHRVALRTKSLREEIERRKRTEAELLRAKEVAEFANRAKTEFLANMSHELRTPLNAVIGFSDMMESEALGPIGNDAYAGYVSDINSSAKHLLKIINDILDVSKIEVGKLTMELAPVDVGTAVRRAQQLNAGRAELADISTSITVPKDLPPVLGDELRVVQVLVNLMSNAVKFSDHGEKVEVTAHVDGEVVEIAVTDHGIGMSPMDLKKLMEPFAQADTRLERKYDGTGLGLFLSNSLTRMMGGELSLLSTPGEGTRATLRMPIVRGGDSKAKDKGASSKAMPGSSPSGRFLN